MHVLVIVASAWVVVMVPGRQGGPTVSKIVCTNVLTDVMTQRTVVLMNTTTEFERRAAIARGAIRADFGEGWMTSGARDMVRIAAFAGFDVPELVKRVAFATRHTGMTGVRLVERVMGEMEDEAEVAEGVLAS